MRLRARENDQTLISPLSHPVSVLSAYGCQSLIQRQALSHAPDLHSPLSITHREEPNNWWLGAISQSRSDRQPQWKLGSERERKWAVVEPWASTEFLLRPSIQACTGARALWTCCNGNTVSSHCLQHQQHPPALPVKLPQASDMIGYNERNARHHWHSIVFKSQTV